MDEREEEDALFQAVCRYVGQVGVMDDADAHLLDLTDAWTVQAATSTIGAGLSLFISGGEQVVKKLSFCWIQVCARLVLLFPMLLLVCHGDRPNPYVTKYPTNQQRTC